MKTHTRVIPMKPPIFPSLMALALAGGAWAASPYDMPYGIQWSFIIGNDVADNPNAATLSPDGTVWITTQGSGKTGAGTNLTWGNPTSVDGGHFASGFGQISRLGGILQGNDMKAIDGNGGHNQGYTGIVAFVPGDPKAYVSYMSNGSLWTDAVPGDTTTGGSYPKMFTVTAGPATGGYDFDGTPAAAANGYPWLVHAPPSVSLTEKFTLDLVTTTSYGGTAHEIAMGASGAYYFARAAQVGADKPASEGDAFTVGDFSGPVGMSYKPVVGKAVITNDGTTETQTLSGPARQPSCTGRSIFTDIDVNEAAGTGGKVYVCGFGRTASGGTMDSFDPDGDGPLPAVSFDPNTPNNYKGYAVVYDATTWDVLQSVTWESTQGGDYPLDITATADGGFVLVGVTQGDMGGNTNPAPGTNDAYMEVYNADGTLAWNFQTETAVADNFGDVTVDSDGSIYVSGNSDGNPTLWRFTSGGTLVWTSTIDNGGTVESQRDHAGDKNGIFFLSQYNFTGGGTPWVNTLSYLPRGNNENLLQKLTPGDFNSDGFVDFADVQLAGTATKPGLPGDDTYDFNGDGDSTLADIEYMITTIMDRAIGDIAQDALVTDVDNADIGRAIGASGVGTTYLDGDMDWDGDVENDDITAVAGAFTGAQAPGRYQAPGGAGATLIYRPDDGRVWIKADEAAGGAITSFQLENAEGTFVPTSYIGPAAGSFGGSLEDVTTHVIADTDLTLAGFDGLPSLGNVLPAGMDQAGLEAYLTTAVYTGEPGSGQMGFTLVVGDLSDYDVWALLYPGADLSDPDADFDGDGVSNDTERLFGLDPTDPASRNPITAGLDAGAGSLSFTRRDDALTGSFSGVETSTDLVSWTRDAGAILVSGDPDANGVETVAVTLSPGLLTGPRLFVRVVQDDGVILSENFEDDDGGFTVVTTSGFGWEHGDPDSSGFGGQTVSTGNGGSLNCWGTNIGNPGYYSDSGTDTDTCLRSGLIDLTGVDAAELTFAHAIDVEAADSVTINILDADGNEIAADIEPISDGDPNSSEWQSIGPIAIPAAALGQQVRIEWCLTGTGGTTDDFMGWYIDDVTVRRVVAP